MKKAYASWSIQLNVECPHCEAYLDLFNVDDFPALHNGDPLTLTFDPGASYKEEDFQIKHFEPLVCPECEKEFKLEAVEY